MDRIALHTRLKPGKEQEYERVKDVVDLVLGINADAFSFEAANPRHEHEWRVWKQADLSEELVLISGFVTNSSVMIEHPVADRIVRYADRGSRARPCWCGLRFRFFCRDSGVHARDCVGQT